MDAFVRMPARDRRLACLLAEEAKSLQAASVEKDFWVCWTLRELFTLANIGEHLTFKGGTSLSKGWGLIDRFSEDIDIIVDKKVLGFDGNASPDHAPSKKQRERRLEALRDACRVWVQDELRPALDHAITARLGVSEDWSLTVDPDVSDGQCLLFRYPGAFSANELGYVRPVVKIELGARSDDWPSASRVLTPYVADVLPLLRSDAAFEVTALAPERTFWEKAMILHEETFRPPERARKERMARHYYDVWCLITRGVADRAAADHALFERVVEHRAVFFRISWVDYSTLRPGALRLVPLADGRAAWQRDYDVMAETMFYGARPSFEEILMVVGDFERRFNRGVGEP
jgi:predicted nucleotidyltransferase component of viral defense system